MIQRISTISARNVTMQLIQESAPRKNCDARRLLSDRRWTMISLGVMILQSSEILASNVRIQLIRESALRKYYDARRSLSDKW